MPVARNGDVELCYDTFGSPSDPALLFISGYGSQMVARPDALCEAIAARGFHFIRFDNRDVGLSTKCEGLTYTLDDMAADAVAVLDDLDIEGAHVVGMSMGGMIGQVLALNHPERVLSFVSLMSHTGTIVDQPTPEALSALATSTGTTREQVIADAVAARRLIAGSGFPFDEDEAREIATASYDRSYYPEGKLRQLAAIQANGQRDEALSRLEMPVTVVHGTEDPLIPVGNGIHTAKVIPNAELVLIEGMGHDHPRGAWDQLIDAFCANARRVAAV